MLAKSTGAKAWADSSAAAANDSPQLSIAAPVQMRAELDPGSGAVSIGSSEVQNNGTSDVLMESAAFRGAEGVSGTWTVDVAGASAVLGADGVSGSLGDAEVSRGSSSPLTMSTTFSGFSAGKMVDKSLGLLTLTFKEKIETFAVYSDDDKSLTFYRRGGKPRAGDAFCGKTATEVYEGFEKEHYVFETEGSKHVPWFDVRKQVKTVSVADDGIRPWYVHAWFAQMESLTSCDIANLDTSQCTVFYDMFNGCSSLESLDLTHMDTSSAIYMGYMLKNCPKLKSVDVSSFDTSRCQDLSILFSGCTELAEIKGLGNWDTSACRWMNLMFNGCKSLTEIDGLENWDVRSVETMESMFELCENLRRVDVSRFEGASLASAHAMFYHCHSLKTLDVSSLVTGACTDIICMFDGCTGLGSIQGLDKWDVSNVSKCHQAFYYCCSMQAIDVGNWRISPSGTIQAMFYRCSAVRELDLSGFDTSTAASAWGLFDGDSSLKKITFGAGWKWVGTTGYLPEPSADRIDGADGKWYAASDGASYSPADIPAGKADTYYAVAPSAFAVYSADDESLDFYNRSGKPAIGDTWQGKSVDGVYAGFETARYDYDATKLITDGLDTACSTPWYSIKDAIKRVSVVDAGIKAASLRCWFANMLNVETVDIGKLEPAAPVDCTWLFINCRKMTSASLPDGLAPSTMADLFYACMSLADDGLSMPNFDMSSCKRSFAAFAACCSLTTIPGIEHWDVSSVCDFGDMFMGAYALSIDLSDWDVSASDSGSSTPRNFNVDAPGIILPKAWQPTAFAVFSADDGSLDFYKRELAKMPKAGDAFEGKIVTEVYTGFEHETYTTTGYDPSLGNWQKLIANTPWFEVRDSVTSIRAVDAGISPINLTNYFYRFEKVRAIDFAQVDLSRTISIHGAFCCDYKVESINLPGITAALTDAGSAFAACYSLRTVSLGPSDFSGVSSFFHMFMGAGSLALDCSDWNVRKDAGHDKFNLNAPGVILPSAWLTAAAAANTASETAASSAISVSSDNTPAKNPSCDHRPAATTARAEDPAADGELPKGAESEQEPQNTEKEKRRDMGRTIHCPEAQC